jgi:hypothetical protein
MASPNFSKFIRPEIPTRSQISDRDLDIIEAVLRYRFSPTSELLRLVGGNEKVTHRRLRRLWERGLLARWAFPGIRVHGEFNYYLDNRAALDLLAEYRGLQIHEAILEELRNNREKDYSGAVLRGQHMQLGFLQHSLMISRLHFCLEMAARASGGKIALESWTQGSQLAGRKVEVPRVQSTRSGNEYFWRETDGRERLPVEPDALPTLRFFDRPTGQQLVHFFYEADRGTMTTTDLLRKLRAYYYLVKKQQASKPAFGVHPVRAILIETTSEPRARRLMQLVHHQLVAGNSRRCGLFWFTISPMLTDVAPSSAGRGLPNYLEHPDIIFSRLWALPDQSLHSLLDEENS